MPLSALRLPYVRSGHRKSGNRDAGLHEIRHYHLGPQRTCVLDKVHMHSNTLIHCLLFVSAQGNFWNSAEIEIKNSQVTLVCVQATKGYGIYGDIAVDNVYLLGRCCALPTTTTITPPPPPPSTTTTLAPSTKILH